MQDDIAAIVSIWTGIPVSKLMEGEMQKLLKLQDELDKKVIGQQDATKVVAEAIQRFIYIYSFVSIHLSTHLFVRFSCMF